MKNSFWCITNIKANYNDHKRTVLRIKDIIYDPLYLEDIPRGYFVRTRTAQIANTIKRDLCFIICTPVCVSCMHIFPFQKPVVQVSVRFPVVKNKNFDVAFIN